MGFFFSENIEDIYTSSGLGGETRVSCTAKCSGSDSCKDKMQEIINLFIQIASSRLYQSVIDAVRDKVGNAICIPHLPSIYNQTKYQVQSKHKWTFSLQDALEHLLEKCSSQYTGSLMAYAVRSGEYSTFDHMNIIYINMPRKRKAECYLFEPNGIDYVSTNPDGLNRLTLAWNIVANKMEHVNEVHVIGGSGIQTVLGLEFKTLTGIIHRGDPICGAVGWWMFIQWLSDSPHRTYIEFEKKFIAQIHHDRLPYRKKLHTFISDIATTIQTKFTYTSHQNIFKKDILNCTKHLVNKSDESCRISVVTLICMTQTGNMCKKIPFDFDLNPNSKRYTSNTPTYPSSFSPKTSSFITVKEDALLLAAAAVGGITPGNEESESWNTHTSFKKMRKKLKTRRTIQKKNHSIKKKRKARF